MRAVDSLPGLAALDDLAGAELGLGLALGLGRRAGRVPGSPRTGRGAQLGVGAGQGNPWTRVITAVGAGSVIEMFTFLALLLAGVAYAWREGALRWA